MSALSGGLNINSVPDRAVIGIDIRTIPGQSHAKIRRILTSYLGTDVTLDTLLDAQSVWTNPRDRGSLTYFEIAEEVAESGKAIAARLVFHRCLGPDARLRVATDRNYRPRRIGIGPSDR